MAKMWKSIQKYEGLYKISTEGEIYGERWKHYLKFRKVRRTSKSKFYFRVILSKHDIKTVRFVHHLVLETFIGSRPEGMYALHKNDNQLDNRLENLYWGTSSDNRYDAYTNGRCSAEGQNNGRSLLTEEDVREIKRAKHEESAVELAKRFSVSKWTIYDILNGRNWSHI